MTNIDTKKLILDFSKRGIMIVLGVQGEMVVFGKVKDSCVLSKHLQVGEVMAVVFQYITECVFVPNNIVVFCNEETGIIGTKSAMACASALSVKFPSAKIILR